MQHISIENSQGNTWLIDNTQSLRASDVVGLGLEFDNEYLIENGNSRIEKQTLKLSQFKADFHFGRKPDEVSYQVYYSFVEFLSHTPLYLVYSTDAGQKKALVMLTSLSKTQMQQGDFLKESFVVDRLSPWYKIKHAQIRQNSTNVTTRGKVYGFVRPYVYTQNSREKTSGYKLKNDSVYLTTNKERMSPLKITVSGFCINPYWEVFQGSTLVSSDSYSLTLQDGQKLTVSSLFQERTAILTDQNGVESSVYQQQDITKSGFVHAPIGESTIVFHVGNASVDVEIYEEADLF